MTPVSTARSLRAAGRVTYVGRSNPQVHRTLERSAAAERANYQLFLIELCDVLDVPRPDPATGDQERDAYVFERPVRSATRTGRPAPGFIDLYRRRRFVLETKQGCEAKQRKSLLERPG